MILVTGAAGFIGSHFVLDWLATHGEPVLSLDALTYAGNRDHLGAVAAHPLHTFVHGDVADTALVEHLLRQHAPRAVVHFAAESHVDRSIASPEAFLQTNVVGTFRLLEAVRGYWAALPATQRAAFRFLQVSTDEVYGSLPPEAPPAPEAAAYAPGNPYSATKAAADHLVRAWHQTYGLPVLVTHCSNNYGPHQYREKLLPCLLENACAGKPLPVYGDGLQVRDWLYVKDHTAALRLVLEGGRVGETYHIAAGNQPTNLEVVHTVCRLLDELRPRADGRSYAQQVRHVPDRLGHDRRYALDTRKLRQELGWQPEVSLEEGLRETVGWYLQNL